VPPNIQRFLPFLVIAVVLLFVLPAVLKKKSSGPSAKTASAQTIDGANLVDQGEVAFKTANGHYTQHLADLVSLKTGLAADLAVGMSVQLDVSSDGQSYVAQVTSTNLSLVRARRGDKLVAQSCVVVKSGSGVKCPVTPAA
jgi:hypothetical protein